MSDDRFCSNCREPLPRNAETCPSCGVFAGDVFEGRTDVQKRAWRKRTTTAAIVVIVIGAAAAAWFFFRDSPNLRRLPWAQETPRFDTGPVRVVSDRPGGERRARGAALTESEAVRVLRKYLTSSGEKPPKSECLAILSNGPHDGGYLFTAVDSCQRVRLGKWRVDGRSEAVSRAK